MREGRREGKREGGGDMDILSRPDGGRQTEHILQWSIGNLECPPGDVLLDREREGGRKAGGREERKEGRKGREKGGREGGGLMQHYPYITSMTKVAQ